MPTTSAPRTTWRSRASGACGVLALVALLVAVLAGWAQRTLFDSSEFATRSVSALDSATVRHALAEELTAEIVAVGPSSLASFRSVLVGVVEEAIETDAFHTLFRAAVEEAHSAVVSRHADQAVLELGETLKILASSTEDANPTLAQQLPDEASSVLVDATPALRRADLWRWAERVEWLDDVAAAIAVAATVGAVVLAHDRRMAVVRLGVGLVLVGQAVVLVTIVSPDVIADRIPDAAVTAAVRSGVVRFMADLAAVGLWIAFAGVMVAAATTSSEPPHIADRAMRFGSRLRAWLDGSEGRRAQLAASIGLVVVGFIVITQRSAIVPLVIGLGGAYAIYVGFVLALRAAFGALPPFEVRAAELEAAEARLEEIPSRPRFVVAGGVVVVAVASFVLLTVAVSAAGARARSAGEMRCNGHAELCDRRLDQVAFAGSHNSMSAANDPGWLFAEQLTGIPAQLDSGVRALLLKSHYGIATGVDVGGAQLVATDKAAETSANAEEEAAELGPEAVARAKQLEALVPPNKGSREVYLCHVYCELGATRFADTLRQVRQFMDRNPDDVVMLFIGDFVTAADTAKVFDDAHLTDRLWSYDTSQPPPTLRQMIDAHRTLLVLTENSGPPPSWYTKGYGIFQDTPFTFAAPADFSCAVNRGPADAPLFEINHFITNASPPSATEAQTVNSAQALRARIATCRKERNLFPNIVAVDFASVGDLQSVIDDLNGV